jgi:hypothetical protein
MFRTQKSPLLGGWMLRRAARAIVVSQRKDEGFFFCGKKKSPLTNYSILIFVVFRKGRDPI